MKNIHIKDSDFNALVLENEMPVLVDFYADWCGPCKRVAPLIEEIAEEYDGKACVYKMNVDENPDTAAMMKISSIPALFFFKNGKVEEHIVGVCRKEQIKQILDSLKNS